MGMKMLKSIKDLFSSANKNNRSLIELIQEKKKCIEKEYDNSETINEDFLFMMLSKGYINENYSDYLSQSYSEILEKGEYTFVNNVKTNASPDFKLEIESPERVISQIKDYQWTFPSVLNNQILTHIILNGNSLELEGVMNAIQNYYAVSERSDFIDQYVESIRRHQDKNRIVNALFGELLKQISLNSLLSFFSDNSGMLFCDFLNGISEEKISDYGDSIRSFLRKENRQQVLGTVLSSAAQQEELKKKIKKIDIEIEKLSYYKNKKDVWQLLIDEAMFRISKENLDSILRQLNDLGNDLNYDYFTQCENIWKKITNPDNINDFVEKILLVDDELHFSGYDIGEILFNEKISFKNIEDLIKKIKDESVYLEALPEYLKNNINKSSERWGNIVKELLDLNKLHLDFNNILYVYKLCSTRLIQFVKIVFKRFDSANNDNPLYLEKLDKYADENYLSGFFDAILVSPSFNDELFEKTSNLMISLDVDIIKLMIESIELMGNIPETKMQILVKQIFINSFFNDDSISDFIKIINKGYGDFSQGIAKIRENCLHDWNCKNAWNLFLSIILKNENDILEEKQIDSLIKLIALDDFGNVIREWAKKEGKQKASNNVRKIMTIKHLNVWMDKFGRSAVIDFLDNYKPLLDVYVAKEIKELVEQNFAVLQNQDPIEKSNMKVLIDIAEKHKIPLRAVIDRKIRLKSTFEQLIALLQINSNTELDLVKIKFAINDVIDSRPYLKSILETIRHNPESKSARMQAYSLFPGSFNKSVFKNDLFVLGRYFYIAMDKNRFSVNFFLDHWNNDLLNISSVFPLHPLLCGAVFEGFFDNDGNVKRSFSDVLFPLLHEIQRDRNSEGYEFIRDCLVPFRFKMSANIASLFNLF